MSARDDPAWFGTRHDQIGQSMPVTPAQEAAARAYLRRRGASDLAAMLGLEEA